MSMFDRSYCATYCDQEDCERNLRFYMPIDKIYTATTFDDCHDEHVNCPWKVKKGE